MAYDMVGHSIRADQRTVLAGMGDGVELVPDETGCGVFLRVRGQEEGSLWSTALGVIEACDRFTACSRGESTFWMEPHAGGAADPVPGDTQWLLTRRTDGLCVLLVPLIDGPLRFTLDGRDGALKLWADSGDADVVCREGVGAFPVVGDDPYALQEQGATAVLHRLNMGTLRKEKALPDFVDLFGWCTWDAFYRDRGHFPLTQAKPVCQNKRF